MLRAGPVGAPQVAEGPQQRVAGARVRRLGGQRPERADGDAELLEVGAAPVTAAQVGLDAASLASRQRVLEVVRDELDELAALELGGHGSRYLASCSRTALRARCRMTRWLPSLTPSAPATSGP